MGILGLIVAFILGLFIGAGLMVDSYQDQIKSGPIKDVKGKFYRLQELN